MGQQPGVADEVAQVRHHLAQPRRRGQLVVGDAGHAADHGRKADAGVDQGVEPAQHLAAPEADGADLDDVVGGRAQPGRLQVEADDLGEIADELEAAIPPVRRDPSPGSPRALPRWERRRGHSKTAASSASSERWPLVSVTWAARGLSLNFSTA